MNPKYYRATGPRANVCPWCGVEAKITGQNCGHLYKVTAKGVWFWFWGVRPVANAMEAYGAVPNGDKWTVKKTSVQDLEFKPISNVRDFATFEEADKVARDIAAGVYPDIAPAGRYINMR